MKDRGFTATPPSTTDCDDSPRAIHVAMEASSSSGQTETPATETSAESLRLGIIAHGEEIRRLKKTGSAEDAALANKTLEALLALKANYLALTGEEYRKSTKRSRVDEGSADTNVAVNVQPRRPKQAKFVKPPKDTEAQDPMALPPGADTFPPWEPRGFFSFEVLHSSKKPGSRARVGRITTPHGVIETPAFVPVGTNAALKCLDERHAREAKVQLMFCNSACPSLRPVAPACEPAPVCPA